MPKPKKGKTKTKDEALERPTGNGAGSDSVATAVAEPPDELQPPATPVEPSEPDRIESKAPQDRDRIATSLNIAKLQAMSMGELNQMARDLGVENFGTMRKHEVIFHILQKNA